MGNFIDYIYNSNTRTNDNNETNNNKNINQQYSDILSKIFSIKIKSINIPDDFAQITSKIELMETDPLKMLIELYVKMFELCGPYIELQNKNKNKYKYKHKFIKSEFNVENVIDKSKKIKTTYNEREQLFGNLISYLIPNATSSLLNISNITLSEYNNSFDKELPIKRDMFGISKKCLAKMADYIKLRFINIYNDIYSDPASRVNQITIGRACYIYKVAKKGPVNDIESFRRILVIPNIVSHFHRILNTRLDMFMRKNKIIDTNIQKGGISGIKHGMIQQIYKIKHIISHIVNKKKSLAIMFVDISDAYGSLNLSRLYKILELYKIDGKFINYIREYYGHLKYYYGDNSQQTIDWEGGLIQGCPLSGLLFVTALNFILVYINNLMNATHGIVITKSPIIFLAYVDDICITCNNMDQLEEVYNKLKELLATIGLFINISKCAKMTINLPTKDIEGIPETKVYKYLGENISSDGTPIESYLSFVKKLSSYLISLNVAKSIDNAEKMKRFKTLILPFIKRKMIILYDITIKQKFRIMNIINYYVSKWNDDKEDIHILVNIAEVVESMNDEYIKNNFNANDYECIRDSKFIIHNKNITYNYDDVHKEEDIDKALEDINNLNNQ